MKYEFGVAELYHCAGAGIDYLGEERYPDYASAKAYADTVDDCRPTIYIIINDRYAFYCEPYHVALNPGDVVPYVYSIKSMPWGQVETRIWWGKFIENPEAFFHLAVGEIGA
jgi:hypothetical protein